VDGEIAAQGSPADLEAATDTDDLASAVPELIGDTGTIGVSAGRREASGE
jgi:hypothetical protein